MPSARRALWALFGAAVIVPDLIGSVTVVRDDSLSPRLHRGDVVVLDRCSVRLGSTLPRGALVAHYSYATRRRLELARLVGLANDWIVVDDEKRVLVPHGCAWLEGAAVGDGAEPLALLHARVAWVVWPPNRFGPVIASDNDIAHRIRASIWDR